MEKKKSIQKNIQGENEENKENQGKKKKKE